MEKSEIYILSEKSRKALMKHDYSVALNVSQKLALENVPVGLFNCGLIYEHGWGLTHPDMETALQYFRKLAIYFNESEGFLGCVRIILARHDLPECERAISYCMQCIDGPSAVFAYLSLGRVYEELHVPPQWKLARRAYLRAFFRGSPFALRKYASSLMRCKKYVSGVMVHIIATILSPLMLIIGGRRVTRIG